MGRLSAACIAVAISSFAISADEPPKTSAVKKLAEALGEATTKGDYAKVIDHTYDGIVKALGGRAEAIETMKATMKLLTGKGFTIKVYKVGDPGDFLTEGGNTFVIVPTIMEMATPKGKAVSKSYLLGISSDAGKTWKFADGSGMDNKEFRDRVLPRLPAKLKLPPKQKPKLVTAPSSDEPQPLHQEVQQPWVKAGAQVGWAGSSTIVSLEFRRTPEGLVDVVPAFRFTIWNEGAVGKLPVPKVPFGLDLLGTEATDAALKELATLASLRTLNLAFTKVTDDGVKKLSGLKSLHVLSLYATKVTDVGLKELAGLKSLHTLDLRALRVTDMGLKELAALNSLHTLDLGGANVTNVGLKELAKLKKLKSLDLRFTKVTDAGLKELAGVKSLQRLDLTSTQVTDAGVKDLKKALLACKIVH